MSKIRQIAGTTALMALLAVNSAYGQANPPRLVLEDDDLESAYMQPFIEVNPSHPLDIDNLDRSVIFVFSPECGASWQIHDNIFHWGQTLPEGWRFIAMPIAGPSATAPALVNFAARRAVMAYGDDYSESAYWHSYYERAQSAGIDLDDVGAAVAIAVEAGANETHLREMIQEPDVIDATIQANNVIWRYSLDRTPSLIIGDRYVTHPDLAGTNPLDVLRISNALLSQIIQAGPDAIEQLQEE